MDGSTILGSVAVESGTAALSDVLLRVGSHVITAAYTDPFGSYADSQSTALGPESIITTIAGTGMPGYSGDQGPATQAELFTPNGVAVDTAGNIFIADTHNNVVRRVDHSTGLISTVAGNGYTGPFGMGGFSGDGGPATDAELSWPVSVAVDAAGNLFISDEGNSRIREVNQATGVITTVVGNGTNGDTGDGGPATSAAISNVYSIVLDAAGDLFVADKYDGVVREVNAATGEIATIAGVPGSFQFGGDGGPATCATFMTPDGLAINSAGDLFIADYSTQRVRVVNHATGVITTVAGNGIQGNSGDGGPATSAEISAITGICVDAAGNLYIADYPGLIREVAAGSGTISTIAGNGNFGFAGDGGPAIEAELFVPNDISLDSAGNLVVADTGNQRIRQIKAGAGGVMVTVSQATTTIAVTASTATVLDGETVDLTVSVSPVDPGVASPSEGTVTFLDNGVSLGSAAVVGGTALLANVLLTPGSHSITASYSDLLGNFAASSTTVGPNSVISTVAGNVYPANLHTPTSVAVDAVGNVFIADRDNNVIRKIDRGTGNVSVVAGTGTAGFTDGGGVATQAELNQPIGVAVDAAGNLYIADELNNIIRKVDLATGTITTVAGNQIGGYSGDDGPATEAELNRPNGIAIDAAGDLFIADYASNVVRKVNGATGIITTIAGNGTQGYNGDDIPATEAELNGPNDVAVDAAGNVYLADFSNNRIREVDHLTGLISTVAGDGLLQSPTGIGLDAAGNIYIADRNNNVIREVDAITGAITTIAGTSVAGYSGDSGLATAARLNEPWDVAVDLAGNVFIADALNNRVRQVTAVGATVMVILATPTPIGPVGAVTTTFPEFAWTPVADAANYLLVVKDAATGVNVDFTLAPDPTGYAQPSSNPLVFGRTYQWTVAARDSAGNLSPASAPRARHGLLA